MKGILARKVGMTRVVCPDTGKMTAVTLLESPQTKVLQVKTVKTDGYDAVVLGSFERNNFGKNENKKYKFIQEMRTDEGDAYKKGDTLTVGTMEGVETVKLTGVSKGRGFAGVIKRHNFSRGPETHGSGHHREPGSVGMCAKPGRILRGKKLPGHYGVDQTTLRSVKLVEVDEANNLVAIQGAVPGAKNSYIFIRG